MELLDRLVERGTRFQPTERPSLLEFAQELAAWLELPAEELESPPPDLSDLQARITRHTAPAIKARDTQNMAMDEAGAIYNDFLTLLRDLEGQIDAAGVPAELKSTDVFYKTYLHRGTVYDGSVIVASDGAAVIGLAAEFGPSLFAGFGYRAYSDGEIQVAAGYIVGRNDFPQEEVFIRHEKFEAGSARQAQLVSEIHEAMTAHLREGLTRIAELIEDEGQAAH